MAEAGEESKRISARVKGAAKTNKERAADDACRSGGDSLALRLSPWTGRCFYLTCHPPSLTDLLDFLWGFFVA